MKNNTIAPTTFLFRRESAIQMINTEEKPIYRRLFLSNFSQL